LFGFGGNYKGNVNHCFPLNGNDGNPEVMGLAGLLETYREAVTKYELSGKIFLQLLIDVPIG
jgi:hypothetical protein